MGVRLSPPFKKKYMSKKKVTKKRMASKKSLKMENEVYASLTENQFDELNRIITWDNPINELQSISEMGESSHLEIGFRLGEVHSSFSKMIDKCKSILDEIEPITDFGETEVEEDDDFDFETEEN